MNFRVKKSHVILFLSYFYFNKKFPDLTIWYTGRRKKKKKDNKDRATVTLGDILEKLGCQIKHLLG